MLFFSDVSKYDTTASIYRILNHIPAILEIFQINFY